MTASTLPVASEQEASRLSSKLGRAARKSMSLLRRFFGDLIGAHLDGFRSMMGLPLLFAVLIVWEFAQHVIEVRIGFFDSREAAKAVANDPARMAFGWIKMISVYVGGFFVIRYLAAKNADAPLSPVGLALRRYAPYIAYSLGLFALVLYARGFVPATSVTTFRTIVSLAQIAVEPLLILWIVSAATDGTVRNPFRSVRVTGWLYFWALALFFVGRLPVNAAHQLLNRYAMGQPELLLWPMLVIDAVVVGLIIAVIPALYVRIARFIWERQLVKQKA